MLTRDWPSRISFKYSFQLKPLIPFALSAAGLMQLPGRYTRTEKPALNRRKTFENGPSPTKYARLNSSAFQSTDPSGHSELSVRGNMSLMRIPLGTLLYLPLGDRREPVRNFHKPLRPDLVRRISSGTLEWQTHGMVLALVALKSFLGRGFRNGCF